MTGHAATRSVTRGETDRARWRVVGSVAGAGVSGVAGLLLVVVVTHRLDVVDAGRVLTGIALLTVLTAACCLGVDTGLIWLLPRLTDAVSRGAGVRIALRRPLLSATVVLVAVVGSGSALASWVFPGPGGRGVVLVVAAALPVLVASTLLVAAVRGLDRLPTYLLLQFGLLPGGRLLGVSVAATAGGLAAAALVGWAAAAVVTCLVAAWAVRRATDRGRLPVRDIGRISRRLWAFCRPRAVSSVVDASSGWIGVLLVAGLAGSAEAARFGTVSRCALAGLLLMQAVRVATATQFSSLLRRQALDEVGDLFRTSTRWVVLASWPVFGVIAAFAATVLSVFGAGYRDAATALTVVAVAMAFNTGCGNAQTVLLMSGDSTRHLLATLAGLAVTVIGSVAFVPHQGLVAAATAWSVGIVVENCLVLGWLVRRLHLEVLDRRSLVLYGTMTFGVAPAIVLVRLVAGGGWGAMGLAAGSAVVVLAAVLGLPHLVRRGRLQVVRTGQVTT